MKKLSLLSIPLMAISFLASCGDNSKKSTTYTVTFDAGDGKFFSGGQKISFKLDKGTKLLPYIKQLLPPTKENETFAYYEYEEKDNTIDYDDVVTSDITLKANYLPTVAPTVDLTNFSWETIKSIAVTGDPSLWFKIGATKSVDIKGVSHPVRIIGFDHDKDPEGNNLGITFEFVNLLTKSDGGTISATYNKNFENYDYRISTLNNFLNNIKDNDSVINMLHNELKEVIKPVDKKVGVSINKDARYEALSFEKNEYPKLFPLAHDEMVDYEGGYVTPGEGSKYQYYIEHSIQEDRIKRRVGIETGDGGAYWLRSPYTSYANRAWYIDDKGVIIEATITYFSVAPAFCI